MKTPQLKAGERLDIVFENELHQGNAHYLKAVLYDVEKNALTVSQTSPALGRQFLNRRIRVTYLVRVENRVLRFGFAGLLLDLMTDYPIASGKTVEALLIKKEGRAEPTDFRMYFRVKPPSDSDVCLFWEEEKVSLLDISIGGAKFSYPKSYRFQPGETVEFKLLIDKAVFDVAARVRNVREPHPDGSSKNIQFVSVEFDRGDRKMDAALGRAIIDIERALLSDGKL
ncbi:MAG: PilZ domain-containing protein [Smithellaceae bacterium]